MSYLVSKEDKKYSFAEYMALEESSVERHDFYYGELYAMAGGTKNHNNIVLNVGSALKTNKKQGCNVFIDGMKLEISKEQFYVYPDLIYTCNDSLKGNDLIVKAPSIIFEVLSDSTALYDKEVKLKYYQKIESLKYYVLIAQKEPWVEVYSRTEDNQIWKYQSFEDLSQIIDFDKVGLALSLTTIYDSIEFDEALKILPTAINLP